LKIARPGRRRAASTIEEKNSARLPVGSVCEASLTGSTKVDSPMDNSPTSRNVIFSFRRIKKIVCSWRNSGTSSAASYSPRILLRRVNRSSPLGLAHFCILNTVSSTSAGGAAMSPTRLGGQVKQCSLSSIVLKAYHPVAPLEVGVDVINNSTRPIRGLRSYSKNAASIWRRNPAIRSPTPTTETHARARLQINKSMPETMTLSPTKFILIGQVMDVPFITSILEEQWLGGSRTAHAQPPNGHAWKLECWRSRRAAQLSNI
jgi:hypothetical protein